MATDRNKCERPLKEKGVDCWRAIVALLSRLFLSVHQILEQCLELPEVDAPGEELIEPHGNVEPQTSPEPQTTISKGVAESSLKREEQIPRDSLQNSRIPSTTGPNLNLPSFTAYVNGHLTYGLTTLPLSIPIPLTGRLKDVLVPYNCSIGSRGPKKWYAVAKGRMPGLYYTWEETEPLVDGYSGARHKSFKSPFTAEIWLDREGIEYPSGVASHRLNCETMGRDSRGHKVYKCLCCGEVFCTNGYYD